MKENIIKIYNVIINSIIDFFHVQKKRLFRTFRRIKNKFKKFFYYEALGFVTIASSIRNVFRKIFNSKIFISSKLFIKRIINYIEFKSKDLVKNYNDYLINVREVNNSKITNFKDNYSKFFTPKIILKTSLLVVLSVFLIYDTYSWFYNEYQSRGTNLTFGTVEHEVTQYTSGGEIIGSQGDTLTVLEEDNLANTIKNTRYISVKNIGSLDIDYNLSFTLDGTTSNAGVLYYRVFDITEAVNASILTQINDTKMKAYAAANPIPANLETDSINPVSNLTTIPQVVINGQIDKDEEDDDNNIRYYRIDYGMYQTITSALYSGASVAVHANVYTTQRGVESSLNGEGQTWLVENETQFREAVLNALSGDTIKLAENITIDGTVDFTRRIHVITDAYNLTLTGDLTYDFVEVGPLTIDTSGGGKIDVGGNLYMNTPKSKIHFIGQNQTYDLFVGGTFTVNGIQNEEEDGVLLEGVKIVKNKVGNIPVDVVVMSNTRLTIAPNVVVNYVIAAANSTNIEILNNGTITQIQLQNMSLIDSFSKYQIYVYNLDTILGVLGGASIVLPPTSTPYTGPNTGNTLIIRGVSSNDINVSGSQGYVGTDIGQGAPADSVVPIQGELNSYYVYIRDNNETLQGLLEAYFNEIDETTTEQEINSIKKLVIYTMNSAYFENEDFTYVASSALGNIDYLGLANATVSDGTLVNRIADNTLQNKITLKTIVLSKTLTTIGSNAFANSNLGRIPSTGTFSFVSIPSTVTSIGSGAFASTRYVNFEGQVPPTIGSGAFDNSTNGTKFFVPMGAIEAYRSTTNINSAYVYYAGTLSDNKQYFLYEYNSGYGISYFINNVSIGSTLTIPNTGSLSLVTKNITAIGYNAYRGLITDAAGAVITIPTTVNLIDSYAFYSDNITSINLGDVITIRNHAFYNTNITTIIADNLMYIGDYAFYSTPITYLSLEHVETIGKYTFARCDTLFEANLGIVRSIDDYAFSNCPNLGRVWFKNTTIVNTYSGENIDLTVGENAVFTNWGSYLDGRLRVYVPSGVGANNFSYLEGYKRLFSANEAYIYPAGEILGSYIKSPIPYDWGDYSVRSVTKPNAAGIQVTAYEMIEYHGDNLTSSYQLPDNVMLGEDLSATITGSFWNNGITNVFNGTLRIVNNTDSAVSDWTVKINTPSGITGFSAYANGTVTVSGGVTTVTNVTSNGTIAARGTKNISILYNSTSQTIMAEPTSAFSSSTPSMTIISIGEYAFRHANTVENNSIDLISNTLLNIDNHGLENISVSSLYSTSLVSIGNYGLYNTGLNTVNLTVLNSLGDYAMSGMDTLYSVDLGNVKVMGQNAISNNPNLEQIFIGTTDTSNMNIDPTAMSDIGTNTNNRLRIYVPENRVSFYKTLFASYSDYIFARGEIVGSFINTPIPYNIGEYSIREVTLTNRSGQNITGWEIIEYHGADINTGFNFPSTFTVDSITHDVISIGDYAFKLMTSSGNRSDIVNNNILSIGSHAFENNTSVNSFTSSSLLDLKSYAFNNSNIEYFDTQNLRSIESYALANITSLYRINLGSVYNMQENSLYSLPNLAQTFFSPGSETRVFNPYAITDVGAVTANRKRFYVAKNTSSTTISNPVEVDINVTDNCTESYSSRRYTYTCDATIRNNSGHDIERWTTTIALGNTDFQAQSSSGVMYETTSSSVILSNTTTNGNIANGSSITLRYVLRVTSNYTRWSLRNSTHISNSKGTYIEETIVYNSDYLTDVYANAFRSEYKDYFYDYGTILGSYTSSNIPNDIGEYSVVLREYLDSSNEATTGWEIVEYHGSNISSNYIIPTSLTIGEDTYDVIGIGERAYRWASMSASHSFDVSNSTLLYINNYAFYDLKGVYQINLPNVDLISDYAFYNNKLYKVSTTHLNRLGNYAYASNIELNYVNSGPVSEIGEGAFYGCNAMEQMYFTSEDIDSGSSNMRITIGANAFYNVGTIIGNRLRIYVPNSDDTMNPTYQEAYKNTFPVNIRNYIYPGGYIVGNYTFGALPYDIGEYSLREVTINDIYGSPKTGWEVVEYHGPDITASFTINQSITSAGITHDVISIGKNAFYEVSIASGVDWVLSLPTTVILIDDYAFYNTDIVRITGNQITRLGKYSFAECDELTNAIFNSVVIADEYCLYSCDHISYIQFGSGTTAIRDYALWNPYNNGPTTSLSMQVTSVPTTATTALPGYEELSFLGFVYGYDSNFTYNVPSSIRSSFSNAAPWSYHNAGTANFASDFLYTISGNEIKIVGYTGNSSSLTIPDTITSAGNVTYNVTEIAANSFDNARYTNSLTLPRYVEKIEGGFLSANSYIRTLNVSPNNTVFSAENGVLFDYDKTVLIRYPNAKTTIDYSMPNTVTTIGYKAFSNTVPSANEFVSSLETVTMSNSLQAIGAYAFEGCSTINSYTFSTDVPSFTGYDTFYNRTSMRLRVPNVYLSNYRNSVFLDSYYNNIIGYQP